MNIMKESERDPTALVAVSWDKMDQAKNRVPAFTGRVPKDVDADILESALELHLVGVIVHGSPDDRFFYPAEQLDLL